MIDLKKQLLSMTCALVIAGASGTVQPSFAADSGELLKQLEESTSLGGGSLTYESKEELANGLLLKGIKIVDGEDKSTITSDELQFLDPEPTGDGGMTFSSIAAKGFAIERTRDGEKRTSKVAELIATDVTTPNIKNRTNPLWPASLKSLELSDIELSVDEGKEPTVITSPGLSIQGIEATGRETFSLEAFIMQPASGKFHREGNQLAMEFDGLTVRNLERFGKRGYDIGNVQLGGLTMTGKDREGRDIDLRFDGGEISNLYVVDPFVENRPLVSEKPLDAKINALSVSLNGKEFIGWNEGTASYTYDPSSTTGTGSVSLDNMFIDFAAAPENDSAKQGLDQLRAMGYERLGMNIKGAGGWNTGTGVLTVDQYRFEFVDAGAVEIDLNVSGYTEEVARSINKIAAEMGEEKDPQKIQVKNMQFLAAMAGLAINELKISVEDASLLNKVINLQAQRAGQEPQQLAAMVGPMAQIMMAPFQVPEFAASVSAALNTFMQGNKTITAVAKPTGGIVVSEIIGLVSGVQTGQIPPAQVIDRLDLQVTAK